MATSRKTSARTGKVQRGHVPPEDVPAIESDTGSPAARGDSEQVPEPDHRVSGSNLTGSEVADVRGRGDRRVVIDSHGKVNREAETGGAAAARPARRSNSLDSARYTPVVPEHVTGNPVLQDARQVVMETRGMVNTLVERLGRIEKVLGLQENSSSMERTIQHTEESPEPQNGSSSKGKGFDPRNWGNAGIPEIERDLDMQRALHAQVKINPDHVVHNTMNDTDSESDDDEYNKLKELERQYLTAKGNYLCKIPDWEYKEPVRYERISSTPMSQDVEELINQASRQRVQAKKAEAIRPSNQLPPESLHQKK